MKSQQSSIRPLGQRSIPSTFLFRPLNKSTVCKKDEQIRTPKEKGSSLSLSDFLNKKLHRSSVLPGSLQGKTKPFSSPIGVGKGIEVGESNSGKAENSPAVALKDILDQFKHTKKEEQDNVGSCPPDDCILGNDDAHESRKRKHGEFDVQSSAKTLAVLGEDSGTRRRVKSKSSTDRKQPPLFNHYANGSGWWDENMEGVDNEEVGSNEPWEGVGSTVLGVIDWH